MPLKHWFRRDAARKAGQKSGSRVFTLGGLLVVTAVAAALAVVLALPLREAREHQMNDAARAELAALLAAVEDFRADHYRFPDRIEELATTGYSPPPSFVICRFAHEADARNFDDHLEIAVRHRGSGTALVTRYPTGGQPEEWPAPELCSRRPTHDGASRP